MVCKNHHAFLFLLYDYTRIYVISKINYIMKQSFMIDIRRSPNA